MIRLGPLLAGLWLVAWATKAPALNVLAPPDQARVAGDSAWLVVEAAHPPRVTVDGEDAGPPRDAGGVFHLRLGGLHAEGASIRVAADGGVVTLTVRGGGGVGAAFHRAPPGACGACHRVDASGCTQCHRFEGGKHLPILQKGCTPCHLPPDWRAQDPEPLCAACHPDYGAGRHPRLRHPLTSARDPLRPGRALDCASCHDPHAPACLACLAREELRAWCKDCHAAP